MYISLKRYNKIKQRVEKLTRICKTKNPFEIARLFNIRCINCNLKNVYGLSDISTNNKKTIYLSNSLDSVGKVIICAHELGHLFLHAEKNINPFSTDAGKFDNMEYEADLFAVELLQIIKPQNLLSFSNQHLRDYINYILKNCLI